MPFIPKIETLQTPPPATPSVSSPIAALKFDPSNPSAAELAKGVSPYRQTAQGATVDANGNPLSPAFGSPGSPGLFQKGGLLGDFGAPSLREQIAGLLSAGGGGGS